MIEKFTFDLNAPKIGQKKMILVKDEDELRNHVVLKLLAYVLYYDPGLKIDESAGTHYEPDLFIPADHHDSPPVVWIDCGQVALKKVETLAVKMKRTRVIFLKETKRELDVFKHMIEKKVERSPDAPPFEFLAFEPGFVESLAGAIEKTNHFTLYEVMENVIGVALNEQVFESEVYR